MRYQTQSSFLKIVMFTIMIFGALNCFAQEVLQKQELAPSNFTEPNAFFGEAVDIYGDTMVVGSAIQNTFHFGANKVYVYTRQNGIWVEKQILIPDDFSVSDYARFGYTVSIDGNFIAIGGNEVLERYPPDDLSRPNDVISSRGVVFVFELIDNNWTQLNKLTIDHLTTHPEGSNAFGQNISINGNTLVIATPYGQYLNSNGGYDGRVFVYENNGSDWVFKEQIRPASVDSNDYFGKSIDLYENTFAVGNGTNDGATDDVHIFERIGDIWQETQVVVPSGSFYLNGFGNRISIYGDSLLIGATRDNENGFSSGSVYEFERINGVWTETGKLLPSIGGPYQFFSYALDHNGKTAIVSEYKAYSGTPPDPDYIDHFFTSVFKKQNSVWTEVATLEPFSQDIDPRNGDEVALSGNTFAVSNKHFAPGGGLGNQGRVWMYELVVATAPETPTGEDIEVTPPVEDLNGDPIEGAPEFNFTYEGIATAGDTTITVVDPDPTTATPPQGFSLLGMDDSSALFDFHTTAELAADSTVEICIDYSGMDIAGDPANLVFAHEVDGVWQDITSSNDLGNEIICGITNSFSYFALLEVADPVQLLSGLMAAVQTINANNGILNSLDAKLDAAESALSDAKANNDHSAMNVLMDAFINHVEAQRGQHISTEEADKLINLALEIVAVIEGGLSL